VEELEPVWVCCGYVLYVNKQEFSASSWRSNQGYTKMLHGQSIIKFMPVVINERFDVLIVIITDCKT
jgi:hypothetical protein